MLKRPNGKYTSKIIIEKLTPLLVHWGQRIGLYRRSSTKTLFHWSKKGIQGVWMVSHCLGYTHYRIWKGWDYTSDLLAARQLLLLLSRNQTWIAISDISRDRANHTPNNHSDSCIWKNYVDLCEEHKATISDIDQNHEFSGSDSSRWGGISHWLLECL